MLKAVYIKEKNDIEGIEIIKLIGNIEKQRVKFSKFNLAQLRAFLSFLDQTDLAAISEKRIKIADTELTTENIKLIKTLLAKEGGQAVVESVIEEGIITSRDIVNLAFRKRGLGYFKKLLEKPQYWKEYRQLINMPNAKEESTWQAFFERNEWILGLGTSYKYQGILQKEGNVSGQDLDGSNAVISDFLLSDSKFVTFVELKKPSTHLFGQDKNRSGAWSLSRNLQNACSQILEQKAAGLIKFDKPQVDSDGNLVNEKAFDSETILIIGSWSELETAGSYREAEIKKRTLELFRNDSRNIQVVTYDELYERAEFIVENLKRSSNK
ncbi:Shedu anti-phage system protein SduA domain-containing protein [Maribacter sp. 2307UL18-2]